MSNPVIDEALKYYLGRRSMVNPKGWDHVLRVIQRAGDEDGKVLASSGLPPGSSQAEYDEAIAFLTVLADGEKQIRTKAHADGLDEAAKIVKDATPASGEQTRFQARQVAVLTTRAREVRGG